MNAPFGAFLHKEMSYKLHKQYRLPEFDYSSNNAYLISICTKDRQHFFGEIINSEIYLSKIGLYAESILTSVHEKLEHIRITQFIILPNHIHFIAEIFEKDHIIKISVPGLQPLVAKSISSFTNHFKGKVKRWCNDNNYKEFEWQSRFRDRIIRDEEEYHTIRTYLSTYISNWKGNDDKIYFG